MSVRGRRWGRAAHLHLSMGGEREKEKEVGGAKGEGREEGRKGRSYGYSSSVLQWPSALSSVLEASHQRLSHSLFLTLARHSQYQLKFAPFPQDAPCQPRIFQLDILLHMHYSCPSSPPPTSPTPCHHLWLPEEEKGPTIPGNPRPPLSCLLVTEHQQGLCVLISRRKNKVSSPR